MAQDGPKLAQDGPKRAQEGPKSARKGPKKAPRGPQMVQDGLKIALRGVEKSSKYGDVAKYFEILIRQGPEAKSFKSVRKICIFEGPELLETAKLRPRWSQDDSRWHLEPISPSSFKLGGGGEI